MTSALTFTLTVKESESGSLYIELPEQVLEALNWREGDTLVWSDNGNSSWTVKKKS